jgi:hypothetical protein
MLSKLLSADLSLVHFRILVKTGRARFDLASGALNECWSG